MQGTENRDQGSRIRDRAGTAGRVELGGGGRASATEVPRMMRRIFQCGVGLMTAVLLVQVACRAQQPSAQRTRIKDVAAIEGIRDNQLVGYGLVVGLKGTG